MPLGLAIGDSLAASAASRAMSYLLRDLFTTTKANPLGTPRNAEPGPGSWTVTDTTNVLSIPSPGGKVQFNGTTAAGTGLAATGITRACGRAMMFHCPDRTTTNNSVRSGWFANSLATDGNITYGMGPSGTTDTLIRDQNFNGGTFTIGSAEHQMAIVLRNTGAWYFVRNGNSGLWTLIWVSNVGSGQVHPKIGLTTGAVAINMGFSNVRILDLGSPFTSDFSIATQRLTTPSNAQAFSHNSDCMIEYTFNHSSASAANVSFRIQDASNLYQVVARTTDGLLALTRTLSGTTTTLTQNAFGFVTNTTYRVVITAIGNALKVYINGAQVLSTTDANFSGGSGMVASSTGISELVSWPLSHALNG